MDDQLALSWVRSSQITRVYVAGPIAGEYLHDCATWRKYVAQQLEQVGRFQILDPLRGKDLPTDAPIKDTYSHILGSGAHDVYERDLYDVRRADIVLANLTEAKKVSIGTVAELTLAKELRKFVILVIKPDDTLHGHHPFVTEAASIIMDDLDKALGFLERYF